MGIGTIDSVKSESRIRRISSQQTGGGSNGGDGGGGRQGDGAYPPFEVMEKSNERIRIVTWVILMAVMMTFVGLIVSYVFVSTNRVLEWTPFTLPVQVWISTALLLLSSLSYSVSHRVRRAGNERSARTWLVVTTCLGGAFIASQILTWLYLYGAGYYMQSNPYAGFFYFITFLHAVHVAGGMVALGFAVLRTWDVTDSVVEKERRLVVSKSVGEYWHFMDALWVFLVLMFGFWK